MELLTNRCSSGRALLTGDGEILNATPASMRPDIKLPRCRRLPASHILQKSDVPGHLTLVTGPKWVVEPALAWWHYILNGEAEAFFAGTDCKLCNRKTEFEFGQKGRVVTEAQPRSRPSFGCCAVHIHDVRVSCLFHRPRVSQAIEALTSVDNLYQRDGKLVRLRWTETAPQSMQRPVGGELSPRLK
jgi:hypothetical protein